MNTSIRIFDRVYGYSVEISSEFDVAYDEGLFVEYSFYFGNGFGVFITADWYITRLRAFVDEF